MIDYNLVNKMVKTTSDNKAIASINGYLKG